jgi:hypothetical protein
MFIIYLGRYVHKLRSKTAALWTEYCVTHTHTQTHTHTDTHRHTHRDTHRDTHTQTHTQTHTDTHTETHTETHTHRHTHRHTHTHTHRHTHTHTHRCCSLPRNCLSMRLDVLPATSVSICVMPYSLANGTNISEGPAVSIVRIKDVASWHNQSCIFGPDNLFAFLVHAF